MTYFRIEYRDPATGEINWCEQGFQEFVGLSGHAQAADLGYTLADKGWYSVVEIAAPQPKPTQHYFMGKPVDEDALPAKVLPIDKGVPIPPYAGQQRTSDIAETARHMEVGDSVLVPYTRSPIAHNMERATGFKFTQRKEGENLRIWRMR